MLPPPGAHATERTEAHSARALCVFLSLAMCALLALPVSAQTNPAAKSTKAEGPVTIVLTHAKVMGDKQHETLSDASQARPGDVIEYRATYTNSSSKAVTRLVATLPLPAGLEYLPQSALPERPAPQAATSDGVFGAIPLMRSPGKGAPPVPVPYDEYRALRWEINQLDAGAKLQVVARARVATGPAPKDAQAPHSAAASPPADATIAKASLVSASPTTGNKP